MNWSAIAAILLALAVGLGAFGAHGLRNRLDAYLMDIYKTAVLYHFLHALGMLVVSVLPKTGAVTESGAQTVCWLLLIGILLFSGSLYLLALTGARALGAVTPFGGVAFLAAWVWLAWKAGWGRH
jgi:uncharacterized membrane protein YgdD (TMEM256/DUF423 family)